MRAILWVGVGAGIGLLGMVMVDATRSGDPPSSPASPAVDHGRQVAEACAVCHALGRTDPPRVGPSLWNVVDAPKARQQGFGYSPALATAGGVWDEQALDAYLSSPQTYLPGTSMTFQGLTDPADRAGVIAYLRSLPH